MKGERVIPIWEKDECDALYLLMSEIELIIKPTDKGSAVVVRGKYDYLLDGKFQINNTKV